jgi:hypothetical protein
MRDEIPGVRILPMSDRAPGFVGKSIERVQRELFLRDLPKNGGRFRYRVTGLSARPGTVILFQYRARIIASARFIGDEKFPRARATGKGAKPARPRYGGVLHLDVASIETFEPVDVEAMRKAWPGFRGFGHVKQALNATCYPMLRRRLKNRTKSVLT